MSSRKFPRIPKIGFLAFLTRTQKVLIRPGVTFIQCLHVYITLVVGLLWTSMISDLWIGMVDAFTKHILHQEEASYGGGACSTPLLKGPVTTDHRNSGLQQAEIL